MANYENFEMEDFVSDLFFMEWVLNPASEHDDFWEKWEKEHPEKADVLLRARAIVLSLTVKPSKKQLSDSELLAISAYFHNHIAPPLQVIQHNPLRITARWLSAAAAVLVVAFIGIGTHKYFQKSKPARQTIAYSDRIRIINQEQHSKLVVLSDGSVVVLRPKSALSYPRKFTNATRAVSLQGEAFFDVHKDPAKPFLVYSRNSVTRVLGTSFTVSAFAGKALFKVTVNTGKVQVYYHNQDSPDKKASLVTLLPDQQVVFDDKTRTLLKDSLKISPMLSPRVATKIFSFTNAPLSVIVEKLEEAYQVDITYDKTKYAEATITASLSKLPLQEKIKAICKSINAQYEINELGIQIK